MVMGLCLPLGTGRPKTVMSDTFREARDFLLANRSTYDVAYRGFRWPKFERFNWALDWFDAIAAGQRRNQLALWVVFEDGTETKLTFRDLSDRSSQIANYYRELGVRRGDRVLVDYVLDRATTWRHPLQCLVSRLGETCLELVLCPLERRSDGLRPESVALQCEGVARCNYPGKRDHLLCSANGVAYAGHRATRGLQD